MDVLPNCSFANLSEQATFQFFNALSFCNSLRPELHEVYLILCCVVFGLYENYVWFPVEYYTYLTNRNTSFCKFLKAI